MNGCVINGGSWLEAAFRRLAGPLIESLLNAVDDSAEPVANWEAATDAAAVHVGEEDAERWDGLS